MILGLGRAPYVLYGVYYIDLVTLAPLLPLQVRDAPSRAASG